jgi:hypothetical protein
LQPLELEVFLRFTQRLEQAGVDYMVSGSVAAMFYGQPRFTTDIDLIVRMDLAGARRLSDLFPAGEFYFPPWEVVATELTRERRGHFNILHIESGFKADVYLRGNDPLRIWALERVRRVEFSGKTVRMAPPEYVIVRKLEFFKEGGSEKHLRDIRMMIENSPDQIAMQQLEVFIQERGLEVEWNRAKTVAT